MMSRVLVVDDDLATSQVLERLINRCGYSATAVNDGKAALLQAEELQPDLIILDIMMPEMDGWEVLKRLKADAVTRRIPVVMFSAMSDPPVRRQAREQGASEFWVKGEVDYGEIRQRLGNLLQSDCKKPHTN